MSDPRLLDVDYTGITNNSPPEGSVPLYNSTTGLYEVDSPWIGFNPAVVPIAPLTFTAGPNVVLNRYRKIGKSILFSLNFTFTVGVAGGIIQFNLPTAAFTATANCYVFTCWGFDTAAALLVPIWAYNSSNITGAISRSVGWAGGSANCWVTVTGLYEAA